MIKFSVKIVALSLLCLSSPIHAKEPNALCNNNQESDFVSGDGSAALPYMICTSAQLTRLANETDLLDKHFQLGADLNYKNSPFASIGNEANPFTGEFNGDDYTLSNIPSITTAYVRVPLVAPFGYAKNAKISHLNINHIDLQVPLSPLGFFQAAGMVAHAEASTLSDLQVKNLKMVGQDYSGGLVGQLVNSSVTKSFAQGVMLQTSATDYSGGLIGSAENSEVTMSGSKVNLILDADTSFAVSHVGGLIGSIKNSNVSDVFALGDIDYSTNTAEQGWRGQLFGGLIGYIESGKLTRAYYAGKMTIEAEYVGGAIGYTTEIYPAKVEKVFWDTEVSGKNTSAGGEGKTTKVMKKKSFWLKNGFSPEVWLLKAKQYPKLLGVNSN